MAETRSQTIVMTDETREIVLSLLVEMKETYDDYFARVSEELHALRLSYRSKMGKKENPEDQSLNDKQLVETEVATEPITQIQVPISKLEHGLQFHTASPTVCEDSQYVVGCDELCGHQGSILQVSHVKARAVLLKKSAGVTDNQIALQLFDKRPLGVRRKMRYIKCPKCWRFKFKQRKQQRSKLRPAHKLIHRGDVMEDDHVYQEGLPLWLLVRFKFWKFKFIDRKLQKMMSEQGFANHLKLMYYSLKRESGTKVHHANTQASKSVSDVLRTTLGPSSMLKMLLDAGGEIVVTTDGNAILREIDIAHPAAKSMIELSRTQDEKVVQEFYGIHGSIIGPWHLAFDPGGIISCTACDDFVVTHTRWVRHDKLEGCSNVQTLATDRDDEEKQAYVSVLQAVIESHQDSHFVFLAGYAVRALDILQEYKKGENQAKAELVREEDWEVLLKLEEAYIENICVQILKFKPDLVITEKRLGDLACHYFSKAGVSTIRRLRKTDNNRIAKACGAVIVNRPDELQESDVIICGDVIICPLADHLKPEYVVFFTKEASGKLEQLSGLCRELKDIDVSLASFYVSLRQPSFVVQQVRRDKKIKLSKRWWFKYKRVKEGIQRLQILLRYKRRLELEERFKIGSRGENWRKQKEIQQFTLETEEEMEDMMKEELKQQQGDREPLVNVSDFDAKVCETFDQYIRKKGSVRADHESENNQPTLKISMWDIQKHLDQYMVLLLTPVAYATHLSGGVGMEGKQSHLSLRNKRVWDPGGSNSETD